MDQRRTVPEERKHGCQMPGPQSHRWYEGRLEEGELPVVRGFGSFGKDINTNINTDTKTNTNNHTNINTAPGWWVGLRILSAPA